MATILIVDDEPDILFLLAMTFRLAGHEVLEAADGIAALSTLENGTRPDLVVTDLMMPRMDGRALIARLRDDPRTAAIPILLVSANPNGSAGADSTLSKPFRSAELLEAAERLIQRGA